MPRLTMLQRLLFTLANLHLTYEAHLVAGDAVEYIAAASQYTPYSDWQHGSHNILMQNFMTQQKLATEAAKQGVDIIVFPEYGITGTSLGTNRSVFKELCQVLPEGDLAVPCLEQPYLHASYEIVQRLSCLALQLGIYIVTNLAELSTVTDTKDGIFVAYNTQVVFDRTGAIVTRYRKKHLFLEPYFDAGDEDDSTALFTTDFNVGFTLQICFDILYRSPGLSNMLFSRIRDVAMSTAWIDELPFLTAPQTFSGWSRGLEVNLIVSNIFAPESGSLGSGVFRGAYKEADAYTYSLSESGPMIVVSKVKTTASVSATAVRHVNNALRSMVLRSCNYLCKDVRNKIKLTYDREDEKGIDNIYNDISFKNDSFRQFIIHEDLIQYSSRMLDYSVSHLSSRNTYKAELCHSEKFCCDAEYYHSSKDPRDAPSDSSVYMLLAFDGIVTKGGGEYGMPTQVCAVLHCTSDSPEHCATLDSPKRTETYFRLSRLRGTFSTSVVLTSVYKLDFTLLEDSFWAIKKKLVNHLWDVSIVGSLDVDNLLAATLFGRLYE